MARVLVVEDDDAIATPLCRALDREGYDVTHTGSGADAVELAAGVDLVLLDLGLPDADGVEVCRDLRAAHPRVSIVMLTARAEEIDAVVGLDAGADDYVTKPFGLGELLARLRARLRVTEQSSYEAGGVTVDSAARRAFDGDTELELAPKEFDLLALLVREAGTVVARDRIMREVWDEQWYGSTKTLDMHVSWLRRKLGDDATSPGRITTVRGVGLRFEP